MKTEKRGGKRINSGRPKKDAKEVKQSITVWVSQIEIARFLSKDLLRKKLYDYIRQAPEINS